MIHPNDDTPPTGTRIPPRESILDTLIVMAYNVGREHERAGQDLAEGRQLAHSALIAFVDSVDPGQLRQAFWPWIDSVPTSVVKTALDLYLHPTVLLEEEGAIFAPRRRK